MASKLTRGIIRSVRRRAFSTSTAPDIENAGVQLPKQDVKVSKLQNGLYVASLENYSPVSRVAVIVNAGSRFEDHYDIGLTHCLRVTSGLTTRESSALGITRSIQQIGGNIQCTGTREYITYSAECLRDYVGTSLKFLKEITTETNFFPWEVSDVQKPRLAYDLAILKEQPNIRVFELLHEAAFRDTLGRSLYCPEFKIGSYSPDQLTDYVAKHYTSGKMAVIGLGVDHEHLLNEVEKFNINSGPDDTPKAPKYHNGEIREETGGPLAYAALAVEGLSLTDKDIIAGAVLQHLIGDGPHVKYSENSVSRLGNAVTAATNIPCSVSSFSANYTDGGLFGFYAVSQPEAMGKILKAGVEQFANLTKGSIPDQDIEIAKHKVKVERAMALEDGNFMLTNMGEQILGHHQFLSFKNISSLIDSVTATDVNKVAKKLFNGKPCMAAIGNLSHTPFIDELYK